MGRPNKVKKKKRAYKKKAIEPIPSDIVAAIEQKTLVDLYHRQAKGKKLTGADYAFLSRCKKPESKDPSANVIQMRPMTYYQKLSMVQDQALDTLVALLHSGKPTSQAIAAKMLLDKGRQEAPPKADKVVVRFNPIGEDETGTA